MMNDLRKDALTAIRALREWVQAVPDDTPLPTMPGIDGDWLDDVEAALAAPEQPVAVFHRCNNCGHAYEGEPPTQCDCMEGTGFDRVEYFAHPPRREPEQSEPACYQYQDRDGQWCNFVSEKHYEDTKLDGNWPIRALYAAPPHRGPLTYSEQLKHWQNFTETDVEWDEYRALYKHFAEIHGITGEKT
jgi:hypothetical protein